MRHISIFAFCFFVFHAPITAQDSIQSDALESIKSNDLKQIVYKLASAEMEGRGQKTNGIIKASEFILKSFEGNNIGYIPKLNGYNQKANYYSFRFEKPQLKVGKMHCSEYINYIGNLSSFEGNRDFDIVIANLSSQKDIQLLDVNDKVVFIFTKNIFFDKTSLYDELIDRGCRGVILCNPFEKKQFNELAKIFTANNEKAKNKYKVSFSGSIEKTDSLIGTLNYKKHSIATIVVHPRVASSLFKMSIKKIASNIDSKVIDSNIVKTFNKKLSIKRFFIKTLDISDNILGYIKGFDENSETVVISAHYDHLGIEGNNIMYGADDNASGVAAVLEIAQAYSRAIEKGFKPKRSIIFAAFSGEELGLLGSRFFVTRTDSLNIKPILNLNLDMVGRGEDSHKETKSKIKKVYAIAHKRDSLLSKTIRMNNLASDSLFIDYSSADIYSSDQASFITNKIPAVMFFRGLHSDYHTERDTPEKLDYVTMERIARLVFKVSWQYVR